MVMGELEGLNSQQRPAGSRALRGELTNILLPDLRLNGPTEQLLPLLLVRDERSSFLGAACSGCNLLAFQQLHRGTAFCSLAVRGQQINGNSSLCFLKGFNSAPQQNRSINRGADSRHSMQGLGVCGTAAL